MDMDSKMVYKTIQATVSKYVEKDFTDTTNLLGITSVRNIIYILMDIEDKVGVKVDDSFINEMKEFTIENLIIKLEITQN